MFKNHEQLLQLHWDLHHRRQHNQKGPLLFAGDELGEDGLDDLWIVEEPVIVVQKKQGGTGGICQCGQSVQSSQRVSFCRVGCGGLIAVAWQTQPSSHVPDGDLPLLLPGVVDDLTFRFVGFVASVSRSR